MAPPTLFFQKWTAKVVKFADVLTEAQEKGYAEADPTFDVEGIDAAHKLVIMASLAFAMPLDSKQDVYRRHYQARASGRGLCPRDWVMRSSILVLLARPTKALNFAFIQRLSPKTA